MSAERRHVIVVGAGHGGTAVTALLRQHGYAGRITLLSAESDQPYHRPPLSKPSTVATAATPELLREAEFYEIQNIDLRLGTTVQGFDAKTSSVTLDSGDVLAYDALVLATGARAITLPLPGADSAQVRTLRNLGDARWLNSRLCPGAHLVIVGAGYIGLEVAALARSRGAEVTIVEGSSRALGRSAGSDMAQWLTEYHRSRGTTIILDAVVEGFVEGQNGELAAVRINGEELACDLAVIGVGARARTELAVEAGLLCEGGVVVDDHGRTSARSVYAIGDMTMRPLAPFSGLFRLESIPSATEQARQVVADFLNLPAPAPEIPWFWSDQFDLKLQIAGLPALGQKAVVRGDLGAARFAVYHLDDADHVVAVEAMNSPGDFIAGKRFIADATVVHPDLLGDALIPLKTLMNRAIA
ncbi:MAG: ferredoxin reductase [Subtercola sp.]|nr:ferredoxin reductase [Subtercola sp.]